MLNQPLVSIIIPTFDRAHLIGETLDSVKSQTYTNWECIIVDDGSVDRTVEIVNEYVLNDSRFQYHTRPDTHLPGGNGARNYGFELSIGEYVQWFDSDDFMLARKLEFKVKAILEYDSDFVVCENAELYSINPYKTKSRWLLQKEGDTLLNHLKGNISFTTAGPLFKKSFLNNKALFDEAVLISQEWEFFTRLLTTKPKIFYLNKVLYHFRNISDGIRGKASTDKVLNRLKTELKLFEFINSSNYFKSSKYLEEYNRYKFLWILNK
jgi:glycosyltransferase involved in cell wall biosynthesis